MDICLDTNAFSSGPEFFIWMVKRNVKSYISAHAFMELSYYEMRRANGSMIHFMNTINGLGVEIVPFDRTQALIAAKNALLKYDLSNNAVDYAIGAYACKRKIPMVTNNKKHFPWLEEVYTPAELMEKYT